MALNIKDPVTDRLARELSAMTGETITEALRRAIEMRLDREKARTHGTATRRTLASLIDRGRARPVLDARDADEILGYDENGMPA